VTQTLSKTYKFSSRTTKLKQHIHFSIIRRKKCHFIVDVPSVDRVPVIAEPFFRMSARVEFHPAMNFEELKKGLSGVAIK
jgi:hypothetical protein